MTTDADVIEPPARYIRFRCPECAQDFEVKERSDGPIDITLECKCGTPLRLYFLAQQ